MTKAILLWWVTLVGVTDELSVDFSTVLSDIRRHPTGINVDYLTDDDWNSLLAPQRSLREALQELGSCYLRYPGGWKSAINLWSVPPYTSSRPTLAGRVPDDWIRAGLSLSSPDGSWRIDPLDFDEFMEVCRAIGAEPCVVVAYESCYWPPTGSWTPPSREQLIETAAAWVHYANKVKGYGVKYWEIGNESWLNNETWKNPIAPATYAADLIEFSRRMKAEDPAIQIGANGDTDAWWQVVLAQAAEHIDFFSAHSYPCWKWTSYEQYRTGSPGILGIVRTAARAIAEYAPAHKNRLKIMLTEFAAGTFGDWDNTPADLGRALITFDLQGQLLESPQVYFSQFWNTHNIYSELDGGVFDALMRDNTLSPIGRALWIWNHFLGDEMVATTSSAQVRCFASRKADRQLTVFFLNKDTSAREVTVALQHLPEEFTEGEQWVFHGSGPSDQHPVWTGAGLIHIADSRMALQLDPVSVTVILLRPLVGNGSAASSYREVVSLDFDWRFYRGDIPVTSTKNAAGGDTIPADSPLSPAYDDSTWRKVDVPHDYVVEGVFDPKADTSHGSLPVEPAWYRKTISIPASAEGRRLWLEFDGVYRDSRTWLNGHLLGRHASGYTSFRYDITDVAKPGADNLLTVRVDPTGFEGWWYEGGGIYRHTRLVSVAPVHVAPWGVQVIATVPDPGDGAQADAGVAITTTVANESDAAVETVLRSEVLDAGGAVVAKAQDNPTVVAKGSTESKQSVELPKAKLWSGEQPYLYRLRSTLMVGGKAVDQVTTTFGVRTFRFDAERGFLLNGKPVKIKGTCNHQDFAGVGIALPDRIHEFRVQRLREMGANAYRFSHHPMTPELLDACDRLGMLVMDENRNLGDSPGVLGQVESMVLRDRNHPCVILWSLCNEEEEQGSEKGAKQARAIIDVIKRLDPTRPITAAMNGGYGSGLTDVVDVQGFNYHPQDYDRIHERLPQKPMLATEAAAEVGTRGVYIRERFSKGNESFAGDPQRGHLAAYGVNAPGWAQLAETAWKAIAERSWMTGSFVWTGFDYRGEPTPFGWPCISSQFGIMDICGFPKDAFYYYQSWWTDRPVLHILPHWNWPGKEGEEIDVWVHSNCRKVELSLNGESLGAQTMKPNSHLEWKVKYAPGRLVARGVYEGKVVTAQVETTGAPAALVLEPDRKTIIANGVDVSLVTVRVVDDRGRTVPTASNEIVFTVTGAGRLLGVGNGDSSCHESDKGARRSAFNGLCLAVAQASRAPGTLTIRADSADLQPATVFIDAR
jgi:beta-galactosidase